MLNFAVLVKFLHEDDKIALKAASSTHARHAVDIIYLHCVQLLNSLNRETAFDI